MCEAMVFVPLCSGCVVNSNIGEIRAYDDDRLAERPAEAEHDAADDPAAAERDHDRRIIPQRVAPSAMRALALADRRLGEHLAHDRGDGRQDHDADGDAGDERRRGVRRRRVRRRRPGGTGSNPPKWTEIHCATVQQVGLQEEQRPHRVDDRRAPRPSGRPGVTRGPRSRARRVLADEQRRAEAERDRDAPARTAPIRIVPHSSDAMPKVPASGSHCATR